MHTTLPLDSSPSCHLYITVAVPPVPNQTFNITLTHFFSPPSPSVHTFVLLLTFVLLTFMGPSRWVCLWKHSTHFHTVPTFHTTAREFLSCSHQLVLCVLSFQVCTKCVRCKSCGATKPGKSWDAQWSHDFSMCHDCAKLFAKGRCQVCLQFYIVQCCCKMKNTQPQWFLKDL